MACSLVIATKKFKWLVDSYIDSTDIEYSFNLCHSSGSTAKKSELSQSQTSNLFQPSVNNATSSIIQESSESQDFGKDKSESFIKSKNKVIFDKLRFEESISYFCSKKMFKLIKSKLFLFLI